MKFGKKDGLPYLSPPNRYIWSVGGSQMEAACPLFLRPFGCPLFSPCTVGEILSGAQMKPPHRGSECEGGK